MKLRLTHSAKFFLPPTSPIYCPTN